MSFAKRVGEFSHDDQLEALAQLDFERILKEDGPEEYDRPRSGCSIFTKKTQSARKDDFESQYLLGTAFLGSGSDEELDIQLVGGNGSSGTFLISLSNLASLVCAAILLHSCTQAWNNPVHYVMCLTGLFVSAVIIINALLAFISVCLFRKRQEQGTNLLKMHHALTLLSILVLVVFCSSVERFWGSKYEDVSDQELFHIHYNLNVSRNWLAFLCLLTLTTLSLGVVGNLNWPHWNENHVAVLKLTNFVSAAICIAIGLFRILVGICLFAWLDAPNMKMWVISMNFVSSLCLLAFGTFGLLLKNSPGRVKVYMVMAPVVAMTVVFPSVSNISDTYPIITGELMLHTSWLQSMCTNSYCPDLLFASGTSGVGSIFFILIAFASAKLVRPYFVEADKKK